jgi:hypothetical protein
MARFYLLVGLASLTLFAYAEYQGYSPFDDTRSTQHSRSSSGRTGYHK